MLLLIKALTAGRSIVSVTGLYDIVTIVTGVITFAFSSTSEVEVLDLQAVTSKISHTGKQQKQ
jgi:hypothetical protein